MFYEGADNINKRLQDISIEESDLLDKREKLEILNCNLVRYLHANKWKVNTDTFAMTIYNKGRNTVTVFHSDDFSFGNVDVCIDCGVVYNFDRFIILIGLIRGE